MTRRLAALLTIGLLLGAGLLVSSGSTVTFAGDTTTCAGPIVRAESQPGALTGGNDRTSRGLADACEQSDRQRLRWAGLLSLLALAAGAVWARGTDNGQADGHVTTARRIRHQFAVRPTSSS